ncbi:surface antigen domain protein [Escherichia coli]|nr:surface antigen domain protein [Escherichia coli]
MSPLLWGRWVVDMPVTRSRALSQESDTYTTTQQRCKTVYDKSEKMLGYDVTYKIGDQQGKIRMDRDPGTQIPLDSNGQLILNNKV